VVNQGGNHPPQNERCNVIIERAYQALLRLYPTDYKVLFTDDMLDTFGKAAGECRARGRLRFVRFALQSWPVW
jgi:hypothetical protein